MESAVTPAPAAGSATPSVSEFSTPADAAPLTPETAQARLAELKSNSKFREAYLSGDPGAREEFKKVFAAMDARTNPASASAEDQEFSRRLAALAPLRVKASLDEFVWRWTALGGPVNADERQRALEMKDQLFRDKKWVAAYLDGSRFENSQMVNLNLVLSAKVASAEEIERFKKTNERFLKGGQ